MAPEHDPIQPQESHEAKPELHVDYRNDGNDIVLMTDMSKEQLVPLVQAIALNLDPGASAREGYILSGQELRPAGAFAVSITPEGIWATVRNGRDDQDKINKLKAAVEKAIE